MTLIEEEVRKFVEKKYTQVETTDENVSNDIKLFYKNQMTSQYKQEENNLRNILMKHVKTNNDNDKIKINIYYKNRKLKDLLIKNNTVVLEKSKRSHVIYRYNCPKEVCQPSTMYLGYTECALIDRLRNHTQHGSILQHSKDTHNAKVSTKELVDATEILRQMKSKEELLIGEALLIKEQNPSLNSQREGEVRVLLIF